MSTPQQPDQQQPDAQQPQAPQQQSYAQAQQAPQQPYAPGEQAPAVHQAAAPNTQPSYPGAHPADPNAAYTGSYAPAAPAGAGSSPLVLTGIILLGVSLLANLVTPMVFPMMMRGGGPTWAGVVSFAVNILYLLLYAGALVCGILALRRRQRPTVAAMVVGAAAISLASSLVGIVSSYLLIPLAYSF